MTKNLILALCAALAAEASAEFKLPERQVLPVRDRFEVKSLNGSWDFALGEKTGRINVPGNWATQGWKIPQYDKKISALTGAYVRVFNCDPSWKGRHVFIRFDGVLFNYDVAVNGKPVAKDVASAFNLHQFEVTDALDFAGPNTLAVTVRSFGRGYEWDTCDCWCLAGIQRDVELFSVADAYLEDVTFTSDVRPDGSARVRVRTVVGRYPGAPDVRVRVRLEDACGNAVFAGEGEDAAGDLAHPDLWTAETPNLYSLVVVLEDDFGAVVQRHVERVGVKSVRTDGFKLLVNNRPVFLHGVTYNEIDPIEGRAISLETFRRQLLQMKEAHINFLRTAHYPFHPRFYDLCDELGIYVDDEVPMASRGQHYISKPDYLPDMLERTERTIRRDKNRASVTMWTFGNENHVTTNIHEVLAYAARRDPTRPKGLPQIGDHFIKHYLHAPDENQELQMCHYLNGEKLHRVAEEAERPVVQTEFGHSMADSSDRFQEEFLFTRRAEKLVGGCVWVWRDQAVLTDYDKMLCFGKDFIRRSNDSRNVAREWQGVWPDARHFLDSYGDRGSDGIVYANNAPKEMYPLVRKLYAPVQATYADGVLAVTNYYDFLSLAGHRLEWTAMNGRTRLASATADLSAPAHGGETVRVTVPADATHLAVRALGPAGRSLWEDGFLIRAPSAPAATGAAALAGTDFCLRVGRKEGMTGVFARNYKRDSRYFIDYWFPHLLKPTVLGESVAADGSRTWKLRWFRDNNVKTNEFFDGEVRLAKDGRIDWSAAAAPDVRGDFTELGLAVPADAKAVRVTWFGLGPYTATPGKWMQNAYGLWDISRDDYRFDGNRGKVAWAVAGDGASGVVVEPLDDSAEVEFENVAGRIYLTHNAFVAGYGTKFSKPIGLRSAKDAAGAAAFKGAGSFRVSRAADPLGGTATVPSRPFFRHYGK